MLLSRHEWRVREGAELRLVLEGLEVCGAALAVPPDSGRSSSYTSR